MICPIFYSSYLIMSVELFDDIGDDTLDIAMTQYEETQAESQGYWVDNPFPWTNGKKFGMCTSKH